MRQDIGTWIRHFMIFLNHEVISDFVSIFTTDGTTGHPQPPRLPNNFYPQPLHPEMRIATQSNIAVIYMI